MKRAVITGLGIVSSISSNQQEVLVSLREGRLRITFFQELKDSSMRSHIWGNVRLDTTDLVDRKVVCFISDASIYAFLSMEQAIVDAGLSPEAYQNSPCVGLIASSDGNSPHFQVLDADAIRGPRDLEVVGPYVVTKVVASGVSACLATLSKIHGVNYSIGSVYATSIHRIGNTAEQVQLGKQDIAFAGGGEELCWKMACGFDAAEALSTRYNDTPKKVSRTHDAHRGGFVTTNGGGMVMVEELEHALTCGAHIHAKIVGYSATSDGANMVAPSGEGAAHCMRTAMHGVDTLIDCLNSHGTSTPIDDVKELVAIREVLGDKNPATSATKVVTGHSLSATGAQKVTYSLLMLRCGFAAPSINIEGLGGQTAGLNIVTEATDRELTTVMFNSFGFGGTNTALVMRKLKD